MHHRTRCATELVGVRHRINFPEFDNYFISGIKAVVLQDLYSIDTQYDHSSINNTFHMVYDIHNTNTKYKSSH